MRSLVINHLRTSKLYKFPHQERILKLKKWFDIPVRDAVYANWKVFGPKRFYWRWAIINRTRWGQLGGRLVYIQLVILSLGLAFFSYLFTTRSGANFIFVSALNYFHVNISATRAHTHKTLTRLEFSPISHTTQVDKNI